MADGATEQYEFPTGFHIARLFPVDEESAIAELWYGDAPCGAVEMRDIEPDAVGDDRVKAATFVVSLYSPPPGNQREWWEFDLDAVEDQPRQARNWLLDNERRRLPIGESSLTAAGAAFTKIGENGPLWCSEDDAFE